jgi:arylsulfatase A
MKTFNRREALGLLGAGLAGGLAARGWAASGIVQRPPNIILILADDLGYGDLGCYGAPKIKTPYLDRMAREGIRFTDFYCSAAICSPSRAGLLTGRYHMRMGINTVFFPYSRDGLETTNICVARLLKEHGYATACIGKWHLGHLPEYLPMRHGFDYYFGIPYSNDMEVAGRGDPPLPMMRNGEIIEQPVNQDTITRSYAEEAVRFIEAHKEKPFFLYLPHNMPHVPLHASEAFKGRSAAGLYGDVIEEIDWSVGEIIQAFERNGLDENTLMIFTSDNGPWLSYGKHGGSAGPLREGKGTTFEGGMRVPCVMRWPRCIEAGRVEHTIASTLDFLPTFVSLAGGRPPEDRVLDGEDIRAVLFGQGRRVHNVFHYFHQGRHQACRCGKWKLKKPFRGNIYGKPVEHPVLLFNLETDIGEQENLAEKYPMLVNAMEKIMDDFWKSLQPLPPDKT